MVHREAHFLVKNGEVVQPEVEGQEDLQLWYDTKGKRNNDLHKDTLLDMSGNNKHGKLHNFAYEKLSGYTKDDGLVFDGVDDKLVRADVGDIEVVSATKNLVDINSVVPKVLDSWAYGASTISVSSNSVTFTTTSNHRGVMFPLKLKPNTTYTVKVEGAGLRKWVKPRRRTENIDEVISGYFISSTTQTFTTTSYSEYWLVIDENGAGAGTYTLTEPQLEEGTTATPYVPYIPTAKMTYQLNNNIISYGEDGSVKWVKDGKVMERKGINLVRNGNAHLGGDGWGQHQSTISIGNNEVLADGAGKSDNSASVFHNGFSVPRETLLKTGDVLLLTARAMIMDVGEAEEISKLSLQLRTARTIVGESKSYPEVGKWHEFIFRYELIEGDAPYEPTYMRIQASGFKNKSNVGVKLKVTDYQLINLTATFGAGNEPTLEEIQSEPDKWQWLPNPMDLLEAKELKGNIMGDMEGIIDDMVKDEQSGTEVYTDKADDSVVHVEIDGKSIGGGSGKNILDYQEEHLNWNESSWSSWDYVVSRKSLEEFGLKYGDVITFSIDIENIRGSENQNARAFIDFRTATKRYVQYSGNQIASGDKGRSEVTATVPSAYSVTGEPIVELIVAIRNASGNNSDITVKWTRPQLEFGSTATPYEPPAPSPDYPIPIHSLDKVDVVSSVGRRNLVSSHPDWRNISITSSRYYSVIHGITRFNDIGIGDGEEFTVSVDIRPRDGRAYRLRYELYNSSDDRTSVYSTGFSSEETTHTVTLVKPPKYHSFRVLILQRDAPSAYDFDYRKLKIEKGSTATPWTPAPEDIQPDTYYPEIYKTNLSFTEPLRSVGDTADRLFRDGDGLWKIERKVGEYVFDGSQGFNLDKLDNRDRISLNYFQENNAEKAYTYKTNQFPYKKKWRTSTRGYDVCRKPRNQ